MSGCGGAMACSSTARAIPVHKKMADCTGEEMSDRTAVSPGGSPRRRLYIIGTSEDHHR